MANNKNTPTEEYKKGRGSQMTTAGIFEGLKKNYEGNYVLTRGAQDFGNLSQYNMYEKGYPFLVMVKAPDCLTKLGQINKEYESMISSFLHILEYEFRGLDGLEAIGSETQSIEDGLSTIEVITKVTQQSASTFSMRYNEKAGSLLTRVEELYLRGLRDPRTGFKHYNGLIPDYIPDPGFDKECFSFLYFTTDNTGLAIEKAYYIVSAQLVESDHTVYDSEKGTVEFAEVQVQFRGFPITGAEVNKQAYKVLDYINNSSTAEGLRLHKRSDTFAYTDGTTKLSNVVDYANIGKINEKK